MSWAIGVIFCPSSAPLSQRLLDKSFYNFAGSLRRSIPGNVFYIFLLNHFWWLFVCLPHVNEWEFLTWALMEIFQSLFSPKRRDFIESLWRSFLSPATPKAQDRRYCNSPVRLSVRPSVCPTVTFSFRKRIDVFSRNFAGTCHGGVLYSFWYWWNVVWIFYEFFKYWKKLNFKIFFFNIIQIFTFVELNTSEYFSMQNTYSLSMRGEYVFCIEKYLTFSPKQK